MGQRETVTGERVNLRLDGEGARAAARPKERGQ